MTREEAMIFAAIVSVLLGGLIGFLSSNITLRTQQRFQHQQAMIPKLSDSLEIVSMTLFKILCGNVPSNDDWDTLLKASFWLPKDLRDDVLSVLDKGDDLEHIKEVYGRVLEQFDRVLKGEHG